MENEVCGMLRREIEEIESQLTSNIASWLVMKEQYESWRDERRAEYGDSVCDDELEWEKGSSVREYHALYIEPLERLLEDKKNNLRLFDR